MASLFSDSEVEGIAQAVSDLEAHVCKFGHVERSIMAGTLHRKCEMFWCDIITLDVVDDDRKGTG